MTSLSLGLLISQVVSILSFLVRGSAPERGQDSEKGTCWSQNLSLPERLPAAIHVYYLCTNSNHWVDWPGNLGVMCCLPRTMLGAVDLGYGDARSGQPRVLMSPITPAPGFHVSQAVEPFSVWLCL